MTEVPKVAASLTADAHNQHSKTPVANSSHHPEFGLVKLCFTVPDLPACMDRMKAHNIKVLKDPGTVNGEEMVVTAIGSESPSKGRNKALWEAVKGVGFVEDPDGYLIELVQY